MYDAKAVADALIRAAAGIESNPGSYAFHSVKVPEKPTDQGCMVGHLGREMGYPAGTDLTQVRSETVVNEMRLLTSLWLHTQSPNHAMLEHAIMYNPQTAARAMRLRAKDMSLEAELGIGVAA